MTPTLIHHAIDYIEFSVTDMTEAKRFSTQPSRECAKREARLSKNRTSSRAGDGFISPTRPVTSLPCGRSGS